MSGPPGAYLDRAENTDATIIAAADNGASSHVPISADWVYVSAITTDANDWVTLPTGILPGTVIRGWSLVAHEMRTEASSNIKINDVDSDGTAEAAIPATTMWEVVYVSAAQGWVLRAWTKLGAPLTAIIPD